MSFVFSHGAVGIVDHAVERYRERCRPSLSYEEARAELEQRIFDREHMMVDVPPEYVGAWHGKDIGWIPLDGHTTAVVRPDVERPPMHCVVTVITDDDEDRYSQFC